MGERERIDWLAIIYILFAAVLEVVFPGSLADDCDVKG